MSRNSKLCIFCPYYLTSNTMLNNNELICLYCYSMQHFKLLKGFPTHNMALNTAGDLMSDVMSHLAFNKHKFIPLRTF